MSDFDYKEYTKQRDIAQKRIKRMQAAGIMIDVHIPTVKELRAGTIDYREQMKNVLTDFVLKGTSLKRRREEEEKRIYSEEELREKQEARKKGRRYRRQKVAKEYERPAYPKKYQSYLKGIEQLGVDIPPSKLPEFFKYMDYRFAQGNVSKKYVFDIFVDDFVTMLKKGFKADQIVSDFEKFEANQAGVVDRKKKMRGMSLKKALKLWDEHINLGPREL